MKTQHLLRQRSWQPLWAAAPMLAALAAPVLAQTPVADSSETAPVAQLKPVEVKAHYDNGVGSSDAASQGVVDGSRLTDLPLLRPGEVLETVPGLVVTQHSGDGKANQYFLRGYNLDHGTDLASFLDGVPLNMPTHAHGQGYTDLNLLIPELVDTITYTKGPYDAEIGDFGSAGSAHIRYRDTLDHGMANVTVGSYGYRRLLIADSFLPGQAAKGRPDAGQVSEAAGGPRLLYALELEKANGPWALPEDLRKYNGLLRLSDGSKANGWSLDALAYGAHWNSTDQVPLSLIQSGQLCRFCALDPTDGGNTHREILAGEWHSHEADGYTRLSAYAQHYQLQLWSDFRFYEDNPVTMDQFSQWEDRNMLGGQAVQGWFHRLAGRESMTEVGVQLRHDHIRVGLLNTQARQTLSTVDDARISETLLGAYAQNTTWWSPWFRSLLGLRMDRVNMNQTSLVLPQNTGGASALKLQPKMSLIFGPWARTEFFVNAGRGIHSNDARGVIDKVDPTSLSVAGSAGPTAAQAVPALVSSRGSELGLRTEWIPGLQSSLALWRLDSDSELVYSADADIGSTSPNGASHRYGLEWNNSWVAEPWLLFDANMAWTHARYARMNDNGALGDAIPNAVSKVFSWAATARQGSWSAGLNWRYIGPYPLTQDGSQTAPSALVTNFRLRNQITPAVGWSLEVLNLFNRAYYDIAYNQDYQSSPSLSTLNPNGITVHPGEPRQLRLSLNISF